MFGASDVDPTESLVNTCAKRFFNQMIWNILEDNLSPPVGEHQS